MESDSKDFNLKSENDNAAKLVTISNFMVKIQFVNIKQNVTKKFSNTMKQIKLSSSSSFLTDANRLLDISKPFSYFSKSLF